jgi:hypothetical protein
MITAQIQLILAFVVCKSIRHGCMPIASPHTQPFSERLRPPQRSQSRSKSFGLTLILCVPVRINAIRNEELWSDPHSLCAGANKCNTKRSRSKGFDLTLILRARPDPAPMLSTHSAFQRAFKTTTAPTISFEGFWPDPHSLCAGANKCNTKRSRSKGFDLTLILRARPDPAPMLSTHSSFQRAFKTTTALTISFEGFWPVETRPPCSPHAQRASMTTTALTRSFEGFWPDPHSACAGANQCNTKRRALV